MTQSKKYDCQITRDSNGWTAEIIRRVTAKKSMITKSQSGFSSEAEAQTWGQNEMKTLLQKRNLAEQKKRREKKQAQG